MNTHVHAQTPDAVASVEPGFASHVKYCGSGGQGLRIVIHKVTLGY